MESSWRHDKQNAIWTLEIGKAMYVVSEWEDAIFFPDETSWHDVGLSVENCKRICEWHARIAALEAERDEARRRNKLLSRSKGYLASRSDGAVAVANEFSANEQREKQRADAAEAKLAAGGLRTGEGARQ